MLSEFRKVKTVINVRSRSHKYCDTDNCRYCRRNDKNELKFCELYQVPLFTTYDLTLRHAECIEDEVPAE